MLDHLSKASAAATVEERRMHLAGTAGALREKLSPEKLFGDGVVAGAKHYGETMLRSVMHLMRSNPGAVAVTCAGLAWLAIGSRPSEPEVDPHLDAATRWEGEGGNPHPEYDSPTAEVASDGTSPRRPVIPGLPLWQSARHVPGDHPLPIGLFFAALGGVLAASLPTTQIEKTALAGAKGHLLDEAKRFFDQERANMGDVAADLKDSLGDDLRSATDHVSGAIDRIVHPSA